MRKRIIITFIVFTIVTISNQIIFHLDIDRQYYDAEIINKAGKQRMYSQKVVKQSLLAYQSIDSSRFSKWLDELSKTMKDFDYGNYYITHIQLDFYENPRLDSLYEVNQKHYNQIKTASDNLFSKAITKETFASFYKTISENEKPFLISMDHIVNEFEAISEHKIDNFKKMQIVFNVITLLLLVFILFFIMVPLLNRKPRPHQFQD